MQQIKNLMRSRVYELDPEQDHVDQQNTTSAQPPATGASEEHLPERTDGEYFHQQEMQRMLQILKLNLHSENTEIKIMLRNLLSKTDRIEKNQSLESEAIEELHHRGLLGRLKFLVTGK